MLDISLGWAQSSCSTVRETWLSNSPLRYVEENVVKLLKCLAVTSLLMVGGASSASAQSLDFGSLGSSSAPSAASLSESATTQSGLTVNYRVENCGGSYRVVVKLSTIRNGYFWANYTGPAKGDREGQIEYRKIPLWSLFMDAGYVTDEIPLSSRSTVINSTPASLTFGFDPFGPGGIINLPDNERSVTVPLEPASLQRCTLR